MEEVIPKLIELISTFGLKLLAAIAILIIGKFVVKGVRKLIVKAMEKKRVDKEVISFTGSLIYSALWVFVIIAALAQLGIQTSSFLAVIGAAGLAIGLALQGSLSNFAAGFLMIILRPFKVDDYVEAAGIDGVVKDINIFTTVLVSFDNKKLIVPNSKIMDGTIINYTAQKTRRVDLSFGVGYESSNEQVKGILNRLIDAHALILKDPKPFVRVSKLGDSSVDFKVRVWTKTGDYWTVYHDLLESVKEEFDKEKVNIPYPQMDVHVIKNEE